MHYKLVLAVCAGLLPLATMGADVKAPAASPNSTTAQAAQGLRLKITCRSGYDNTLVGQSDKGEFTIQLKDVMEITTLASTGSP